MPLDGIWYNELNSEMSLTVNEDPSNGSIVSGTYTSKVGGAAGQYTLTGITDQGTGDPTPNIGFAVSWVNPNFGNSHSVTTWSGQLQEINGEEVITTFWLLTKEASPTDNWASTLIGQDTFRRTPPTQEQIAARISKGSIPYPGCQH
jgi:hypothetical protein